MAKVPKVSNTKRSQIYTINKPFIQHMLSYQEYRLLYQHLQQTPIEINQQIDDLLHLAQAIISVDLKAVSQLAPKLQLDYLLRPSRLKQRVYSYTHYLNLQFKRQEYADYFRGLSPILVDIFRLIIERHIMPQLNEFIIPVVKQTQTSEPLYKGLQWNAKRIEATDNIIRQTWQHYYGDRFNYDHYVSSSHLVKIIDDHSVNDILIDTVNQMRQVEKLVRNIVAHEVVHVDEAFIQRRVHKTPQKIHQLLAKCLELAGLTDVNQWQILTTIEQEIKQAIRKQS